MSFVNKYTVKKDYLPTKTKRRSGIKNLGVKFVVVHDTGNPNSTAQGNVNYYKNSANTQEASAHVFIDDKDIIICVPLDEKAWHVLYNVPTDNKMFGADANDKAIGVELCYFPNDKAKSLEAYKKYVWFNAWLAYTYKLNPKTSFVGHHILDPARKTDPANALKFIGKTYQNLLDDIVKEYNECTKAVTTPPKEENKLAKYNPTIKEFKDAPERVLAKFEKEGNRPIDKQWREKLANGTIELDDIIGLLFVAIDRGFLD